MGESSGTGRIFFGFRFSCFANLGFILQSLTNSYYDLITHSMKLVINSDQAFTVYGVLSHRKCSVLCNSQ